MGEAVELIEDTIDFVQKGESIIVKEITNRLFAWIILSLICEGW